MSKTEKLPPVASLQNSKRLRNGRGLVGQESL